MALQRFTGTIESARGGGHFVTIPVEIAEAAGLRHGTRVRGSVAGQPHRSSLMTYSGRFHLGVHKATLAAAGVTAGDTVELTIEIDDQPLPTDSVPPDLARALARSPAARAGFDALPPSHKREHVKYILEAKQAETRERRIAKTIATLAAVTPKSRPARSAAAKARPASKPARARRR